MNIIVLSFVEWHGRHGRTHHLVEHLAQRHRILWVNPPRSFLQHPTTRMIVREGEKFSTVIDLPGGVPGRNYEPMSWLSQMYWAGRMRRFLSRWRGERLPTLVLVETPAMWNLALHIDSDLLIYDAHDDWRLIENNRGNHIARLEKSAARKADIVLTASAALAEWFGQLGATPKPLPNACEIADWNLSENTEAAEELERLPHPRFLFFGGVDRSFDTFAVKTAAAEMTDSSWIIVGGIADAGIRRELQELSNIVLIGEKPYHRLPSYVVGSDALILPYTVTPRNQGRDCVKLYEYLATGRPIVASDLPQVNQFRDLIGIARSEDGEAGFALACRRALQEDTPALHAQRKGVAQDHTWAKRVTRLEQIIESALAGRNLR